MICLLWSSVAGMLVALVCGFVWLWLVIRWLAVVCFEFGGVFYYCVAWAGC